MKYMVMECHPGYAVVLDEAGRFTKVANMRYEVGQTVTDVTELSAPQPASAKRKNNRWLYALASAAACLVLMFTSVFFAGRMPYASVYLTINPEVRIDVNRSDIVVGLDGVNEDGQTLIADYSYQKKNLDLVVDELVDRAIEMGFLYEGGKVTLELDAEDNEWVITHSDSLDSQLSEYLTDKLTVTIEVTDKNANRVIIPVGDGDSGYGESDYGETVPAGTTAAPSGSGDGDSGYEATDGDTNYGGSSYEAADGDSNYEATDGGGASDYGDGTSTETTTAVDTNYGDSGYETTDGTSDDGQTDYSSGNGDSLYEE